MTLRTATYDTETHVLVPIDPTEDQLLRMHESMYDARKMKWHEGFAIVYKSGIAAAPEYQEPQKGGDSPC